MSKKKQVFSKTSFVDYSEIPEEWHATALKEQVTLKNGSAFKAADWKTSGVPIIRIQNLKDRGAPFNYFQGDVESKVPVRDGDLLFSWSGSKGTSFGPHLWSGPLGVLNQHIFKVIFKPEATVKKDYLYYALKYLTALIEEKAYGLAALVHVRKSDLEATPIPLPPFPVQRAIAHVLRTVQQAKEATEKVIAATRQLKQSLMRHLFTYGPVPFYQADQVELKETEVGAFPGDWKFAKLEDIAKIVYGVQAAVAHLKDESIGIPIFTNVNISNEGAIDLTTLRYFDLPENKREKLLLRKGDILFNWRSGSLHHIGKSAIFELDGEYTFSSFILRFRVNESIKPTYLFHYLFWLKSQGYFARYRQQSSVNKVFNASAAAKLDVAIPPIEEQERICEVIAGIDRKIAGETTKQLALNTLFNTLLHHLMTSKVRVKDVVVPEIMEVV